MFSLIFSSSMTGFFVYPVIAICVEVSCGLIFPIGEATSTGFLFAGGQTFGGILGIILLELIKGENKTQSLIGAIIYWFGIILGLVLMLFVNDKSKRDEEEYKDSVLQETFIKSQKTGNVNYLKQTDSTNNPNYMSPLIPKQE